jgi:hypothetical protein
MSTVLDRPQALLVERARPRDQLLVDAADTFGKRAAELVDDDCGQRVLVHVQANNDHLIASIRCGRPASGQTSIEAAARLLSGHARRSREGGGDTTPASRQPADTRESSQPPPTRVSAHHQTTPHERDIECENVTDGAKSI